MLQYSVVPLTLSSSPNHDRIQPKRLASKDSSSSPRIPPLPHPIATSFSASSSSSSNDPPSAKRPRSPYISSRQILAPVSVPAVVPEERSRVDSSASSTLDDVLFPGDIVAQGGLLQGETLHLVSIGSKSPPLPDHEEPAREFEVVRRLGAGSYAVVYLVREVLYRPPASDDGHITLGSMDEDIKSTRRPNIVYGREFAIKCLSKANLDEDALAAQMSEVTIHQSLRPHPNIVTLHRTLETSAFLLLLLEYVPGEDLFYFLEQARDHYESDSPTSTESSSSRTPPTPSLLSTMAPSQLLSRTRLRLISSMFSQMCDAVAACHDQQVYHRDIKPENFIVTDGWTATTDGRQERKVVVKLTDFGLSTIDVESSDMDCGSAPYMSYECRNNVAPIYMPRAADVWSLGIVLINMLYHYNPWTDTAEHACSSFAAFRHAPVIFFMDRFAGMTRPVAEMLAYRVFNILDDPSDDSKRISAQEFGNWAKDLPDLLAERTPAVVRHNRAVSISSIQAHPISSSVPVSHRPSSRQASRTASVARSPVPPSRTHSRTTSILEKQEISEISELSTVIDQDVEEEVELPEEQEIVLEQTSSTNKRRKRGARKGKGPSLTPTTPKDETLDTLANASQALAREISRASKASSRRSIASSNDSKGSRKQPFEPVSMYPLPSALCGANGPLSSIPPVPRLPPAPVSAPAAPLSKKPSKWRLTFGKAATSASTTASDDTQSSLDIPTSVVSNNTSTPVLSPPMSATASNVTSLIMGLSPPPQTAPLMSSSMANESQTSLTWGRGRRDRRSPIPSSTETRRERSEGTALSSTPSVDRWGIDRKSDRASSPNSSRSGRPLASSASSMASGNWRSSMSTSSSAGTSTSAFTHYSNSSLRSVSTNATSISSGSWRTGPKTLSSNSPPQLSPNGPTGTLRPPNVPRNIKIMDGVPWELGQLPRQQHSSPVDDIFGQPPARKPRTRKPKDHKLDTINERPSARRSPDYPRRDASTSTTDLNDNHRSQEDGDYPKKVQKGQINALAKMLSALRR